MKTSILILAIVSLSVAAEPCTIVKDRQSLIQMKTMAEDSLQQTEKFHNAIKECLQGSPDLHSMCLRNVVKTFQSAENLKRTHIRYIKEELKHCK